MRSLHVSLHDTQSANHFACRIGFGWKRIVGQNDSCFELLPLPNVHWQDDFIDRHLAFRQQLNRYDIETGPLVCHRLGYRSDVAKIFIAIGNNYDTVCDSLGKGGFGQLDSRFETGRLSLEVEIGFQTIDIG